MKKEFLLTFSEVMGHLKKHPKDMAQGIDFQEGCVFFIEPVFNFFSVVVYHKEESGKIKKHKEHNFMMSVEIFYQKYRIIKELNEIF